MTMRKFTLLYSTKCTKCLILNRACRSHTLHLRICYFSALQEAQDIFGVDFDFDEFQQFDEMEEEEDEVR